MPDRYANIGDDLHGPASQAAAVTPSDSADLPTASKRLHIGTGGTVALVTTGGSTVTYTAATGTYLNVRAARVKATGTTATNIVAEF